jgi:hypothetical protein
MPLWGGRDFVSGNNKPKYANTSNVFGANSAEAIVAGRGVAPGWVQVDYGTGPVSAIGINHRGAGYNANGYIIFTSVDGRGSGANASFVARSNTANATDNVIISVTLNSGGSGYTRTPTATANLGNSNAATFFVYMGGRANRVKIENLVTINDITGSSNAFPTMP